MIYIRVPYRTPSSLQSLEGATTEEACRTGKPYLPGRGRWVIKKAYGLDWRPTLHFWWERPSTISPSGRVDVIICALGLPGHQAGNCSGDAEQESYSTAGCPEALLVLRGPHRALNRVCSVGGPWTRQATGCSETTLKDAWHLAGRARLSAKP
ncbi:hypothetical protein Taro_029940 [Colocasia esculenta]|uniref:Uncharacterized protein n=1 Tax=Colocasia esculenta TaxID=4460 RepID=A0A843W1R9_COLES|nr:hypothetical protein [Colocasia esculenta]